MALVACTFLSRRPTCKDPALRTKRTILQELMPQFPLIRRPHPLAHPLAPWKKLIKFFRVATPRGRQPYFTFRSAPDPLVKASKAPSLTSRVATPSGAPRQALEKQGEFTKVGVLRECGRFLSIILELPGKTHGI